LFCKTPRAARLLQSVFIAGGPACHPLRKEPIMKKCALLVLLLAGLALVCCAELATILPELASAAGGGLTTEEIVAGLKEALVVGATNSSSTAAKNDGFNLNSAIRIPFPQEAIQVKKTLEDAGLNNLVSQFETSLNRSAEEASKKALPIFKNAITSMTIDEAVKILRGSDYAATEYLKTKTTAALTAEFTPVVGNALKTVNVTRYWTPVVTAYNMARAVSGGSSSSNAIDPDLEAYVTGKALEGLFYLIGEEEKKIREDPAARVTELLQKVFGSALRG